MHVKDFNGWNKEKQYINGTDKKLYFAETEIWWCAFGINIGVEIDGKNGKFERPGLVLKYINKDIALVLPLTTKGKEDKYHVKIQTEKMYSFAKIAQVKIISSKRLLRKIDTLAENQFNTIRRRFIEFVS